MEKEREVSDEELRQEAEAKLTQYVESMKKPSREWMT